MKFETKAIRGQGPRSQQREHSAAIHATSSFVFDSAEHAAALFSGEEEGNIYSRYANPTNDEFVQKMVEMEGVEAGIATASGMAAMFASMAPFLNSGDHVLACRSVFGSTHQLFTQLFPRWNIEHSYGDVNDTGSWESLIRPNTKMLFLETPTNPALDIVDIQWAADLAHAHGMLLVVDNCFATPYLQKPARFGADIITHSATKFIDGQGRVIAGTVLGSEAHMKEVQFFTRHTGPALSPFHGWILSKSLETLAVRMDRHCANASELAERLQTHPKVKQVKYPFSKTHPSFEIARKQMIQGGGIVTFEIEGGIEAGRNFLNSLKMLSLTANLGDSRTIATHPASTTHSKLSDEQRVEVGITPGLIRISTGLEHIDDIWQDIEQALG
jgi:O-succinylhomoserine sulfhydrylase